MDYWLIFCDKYYIIQISWRKLLYYVGISFKWWVIWIHHLYEGSVYSDVCLWEKNCPGAVTNHPMPPECCFNVLCRRNMLYIPRNLRHQGVWQCHVHSKTQQRKIVDAYAHHCMRQYSSENTARAMFLTMLLWHWAETLKPIGFVSW